MKKTLIAGAVAAAVMMVPTAAFAGGSRNNTSSLSSTESGLCKIVPQWHWFDWIPCHN